MDSELVRALAEKFKLTAEQVAEDVQFVLGDRMERHSLNASDRGRVESYFHSIYGHESGDGSGGADLDTVSTLVVKDWRQFESIDIDLDSRLTIITGENGTGKTTLLGLLGLAFGENVQLLGTPIRDKEGFRFRPGRRPTGEFDQVGFLKFASGSSSKLGVRNWEGIGVHPHFSPELTPYRNIAGLYLDAQRVIGPYQQLESIPPRFNTAREISEAYRQQLKSLWVPHQMVKSPSLLIKEALVAAAIYGEGNSVLVADPRAAEIWSGFEAVLHRLFPESLHFEGLHVDQGELILRTKSGQFALEASSGGLSAILTLAWQIYLHAVESPDAFTVCFDEPENHLHPSLQRSILPALLDAFPGVRFIVATHSPFVVTSTREANVYALRRNPEGKVYSDLINLTNQAFTADEVLDEVLGVGVTLPIWAEQELGAILADFRSSGNSESIVDLVARLAEAGLRLTMPDVSDAIADAIESGAVGDGN